MELAQPPTDPEQKNIIDKLAQFVARNGPEFEQMTKSKQKDNPRFSFLFGGDHFNYYQYKVTTEQAILKMRSVRPNMPDSNLVEGQNQPGLMNAIQGQPSSQQMFNQNPIGMGDGSMIPPNWGPPVQPPSATPGISPAHQAAIDSINVQVQQLKDQIQQSEQNLAAQHEVLMQQQQQEIEEMVKKCQDEQLELLSADSEITFEEIDQVLQPIISSCTKDSISTGKQWIFVHALSEQHNKFISKYLLRRVTTPGVSFSLKLHLIYLVNDVLHHCMRKNAEGLKVCLEEVVAPMFCNAWLGSTEEQHAKLNKLLTLWESKNNYLEPSILEKMRAPADTWSTYQSSALVEFSQVLTPISSRTQQTYEGYQTQHQTFMQHVSQQIAQLHGQQQQIEQQAAAEAAQQAALPPHQMMAGVPIDPHHHHGLHPPGFPPPGIPPGLPIPDLSKPPPGFQIPPDDESLMPSVPYFELPAGLIAPLIKLEETGYKPLDPSDIRLPPPLPPSDRLLAALELFYSSASHERPRNSDGWEQLGLYEYFKAKNAAKKQKDDDIKAGLRQRSPSLSPIRRSRSRSRSRSPPRRSRRSPRRRSRSKSPLPYRRSSRSRSKSKSPSPSPQSQPNSRNPARTPSPPSFSGGMYGAGIVEQKLDESNRGHQLLKKMGWSGTGLGAREQGIEDPIDGGEVRDKANMYKGVGINLQDPYEIFRKSKGAAFISRMKARAEERMAEN